MEDVFRRLAAGLAVLCGLVLCAPAVAGAAAISGTVSSETTHLGIGGVEVCPTPRPYTFETACAETDGAGHYALAGLPAANYIVNFSGARNNLRYVNEFYDNKTSSWEADLFPLGSEDRTLNVELAEGGSISGTVVDDVTKQPIEGLAACAWNGGGANERCDLSDAGGHYEINGLTSGAYNVEYESWNRVNYIGEFYEDAETLGADTKVSVTAPTTTSEIDDELSRGAEILGHVSEVSTGGPVAGAMVCAPPLSEESVNTNCEWTDSAGNYAIRGLRAGTYQVAFDVEFGPFGGPHAFEWWQGAGARAQATPLALAAPSTTTGIDGRASRPYEPPPPAPPASSGSIAPISALSPNPRTVRCRKGFHRKRVKGKLRCVRKHRHHRRRTG